MGRFLLKKFLSGLLVVWGIVSLLFFIFNLRGSPVAAMTDENTDAATRAAIIRAYHLDRSLFVQYLWYLNDLSPLGVVESDAEQAHVALFRVGETQHLALKAPWLHRSFVSNESVGGMILAKLPATAILALTAILLATLAGIPLGVLAALKKGRWQDRTVTLLTQIGVAAPSFVVAVLLIRIFAVDLAALTGLRVTGYLTEARVLGEGNVLHLRNLILPAVALGVRPLSIITQLTRASLIEVLQADYVRTARAKGLTDVAVLFRHALRNALNPVLTSISGWFASLLAGAFFVETIFDWQGVGKLSIDALNSNDYPVILGTAILIGIIFVLTNVFVDLMYSWLDPRVRIN
jgi:peptide/nickel transport system permease protein